MSANDAVDTHTPAVPGGLVLQFLSSLSDGIAKCERGVVRALVLALPVMILANVAGRALRHPIYWMDELAVLTMVWLAMVGMSLTIRSRDAVAVTMLQDAVPAGLRKALQVTADSLTVLFAAALAYMCYLWFDPVLLVQVNFDLAEFAAESFNYLYEEPTATLGVAKFWFWLILPVAALTTLVHALANLARTLTAPADQLEHEAATSGAGE